jgi:hypothetical protein
MRVKYRKPLSQLHCGFEYWQLLMALCMDMGTSKLNIPAKKVSGRSFLGDVENSIALTWYGEASWCSQLRNMSKANAVCGSHSKVIGQRVNDWVSSL